MKNNYTTVICFPSAILLLLLLFAFSPNYLYAQKPEINTLSILQEFHEKQKEPLTSSNQELFLIDGLIWQRNYGQKKFFLAPSIQDRSAYFNRIKKKDDKSKGIKKSGFTLAEVVITGTSKDLLGSMNINVPSYINKSVQVYLPLIDIEKLSANNCDVMIIEAAHTEYVSFENRQQKNRSLLWSEGWEGDLSPYSMGDDNPDSGYDYWGDVSCESYEGNWSLHCSDEGDQPDCIKYDNDMQSYVYINNGINVSGYSNVEFSYYYKHNTEIDYDFLYRYYSEDGINWTVSSTYYNGGAGNWFLETISLSNFTNYYWQFEFVSDYSENDYEGAYIDDMQMTGTNDPNLTANPDNCTLGVTGTIVDMYVDVINDGAIIATGSELGYYLSADTDFTTSDYLIGTDAVPTLAPGASSLESIVVDVTTLSPAIPPGIYYCGFIIDHLGQVAEANEADNAWHWSSLQLTIPMNQDPDINITPSSLTLEQSNGKSGENIPSKYDNAVKSLPIEYIKDTIIDDQGNIIYGVTVPGKPPEKHREPIAEPTRSSVMLQNVPAFSWCFGCSATSAAMAAGYYDNNGYPDMYTGLSNNGVCPMNNSIWPDIMINGEIRSQCPLSASRDGLDGRTGHGHVDDYWILYGHAGPDPWITNNWSEHTWEDCTADFMGTSQSVYDNVDGATSFYFNSGGDPLYNYTGCEPYDIDGCHGMRDFYESRGYNVQSNYTQLIYGYDGNTTGFTLNDFKTEIDAGRPVMIQVTGHSMLGVGYEDDGSGTIYLHDTWDYNLHSMTWGGIYSSMNHYAVTVVELEAAPPAGDYFTIENLGSGSLAVNSITDDAGWLSTSGYPAIPFNIAAGGSQQMDVTVDWNLVGSVSDTAIISVGSNDPDEPSVNVTVIVNPLTGGNHFNTIWTGNPYQPMNVLISAADIGGTDLSTGDEIGIFDVDTAGNEICVGFIVVVDSITSGNPLNIITSTDDPGTPEQDGFIIGNEILFKAWSNSDQTEHSIYEASFNIYLDTIFASLGTALVEVSFIDAILQEIELIQGWNIMSFCMVPDSMNMLYITDTLIQSGELIKIIDESGDFVQNIPGLGWMNTIGDMANTEGYYIKVNDTTSLPCSGSAVALPLNIPLFTGWNILGYPLEQSQNAQDAVQSLIDTNFLLKVLDESGNFIQFIPGIGWLNTIGNFEPDEGYYIKVNGDCGLLIGD